MPVPDRAWLSFRMETAFGDRQAVPEGEDVVAFLTWARSERAQRRSFRWSGDRRR